MSSAVTAADVLALRDERQISIFEAKKILTRERMLQELDDASTVEDLKAIIRRLI